MSTMVYPIERLTEYVCAKTLEMAQELGSGLEQVRTENPDLPGIDRLVAAVDDDPLPLFALAVYVQLQALHHAMFPDDAVGLIRERAVTTLALGLSNAGFASGLNDWLSALDTGWDQLAVGTASDAWVEPIVGIIEAHYRMEADEDGVVWLRLFYLTLIAEAYRANAAALANLVKEHPELLQSPTDAMASPAP